MYTDKDWSDANGKLVKWWIVLVCLVGAAAGVFGFGLVERYKWCMVASSIAAGWIFLFLFFMKILPLTRYRMFLVSLKQGLKRQLTGVVESISGDTEEHDGATVQTVQFLAEGDESERRLYLNVAKKDLYPSVGSRISVTCCGRHILSID